MVARFFRKIVDVFTQYGFEHQIALNDGLY